MYLGRMILVYNDFCVIIFIILFLVDVEMFAYVEVLLFVLLLLIYKIRLLLFMSEFFFPFVHLEQVLVIIAHLLTET
jgi:hypothetical protein